MKFILFPEAANSRSGFNKVITKDFERLNIKAEDMILWYLAVENIPNLFLRRGDRVIMHPPKFSIRRMLNVLKGRLSNEINVSDIKKFYQELMDADEIWCDDYGFYRSIRMLFPTRRLYVRFHNLHYRNSVRANVYKIKLDCKYRQVLRACSKIEQEIFRDDNVVPIFISKEDQYFYELTTKNGNSLLWGVELDEVLVKESQHNNKLGPITKIVFFGGLTAHKKKSVKYFIENIWNKLRIIHPCIEFHLYGRGTEKFHSSSQGIFGHGFYDGENYPFSDSSIYINPDLIGGGVKVKVADLLENGIPFITNEFGFEGYDDKFVDNRYCICTPLSCWQNEINNQIETRCGK